MKTYSTRLSLVVIVTMMGSVNLYAARLENLKFEIYQDASKEHRWRLKNSEGKVLATPGQGYASKKYCEESVEKFKANVDSDKVKFEIYQDNKKEERWRLISSNGQTVATSGAGYQSKSECEKAISLIKKEAKKAKVEIIP